MNAIWSEEFHAMWKVRLAAMQDKHQPFSKFIEKISELEINDAFVLALDKIERLQSENTELLNSLVDMANQYLAGGDGALTHKFMGAGECCLGLLERLGKVESDDGVFYTWVKEVKP
jgi:hypothetical protein